MPGDPPSPTRRRRKALGAPSPADLGRRIRAERERLGLTQVQAASRLGISQGSYSDREDSTTLPYGMAFELVRVLGMDPRALCPEFFDRPP